MTTARIPLLHRYANPAAFGRLAAKILPWTAGAAILMLGLGLYYALFDSPPDYQQGNSVRIMYVHVPAAIMSEVVYGMMAAAARFLAAPLAGGDGRAAAPDFKLPQQLNTQPRR